MFSVFTLLASVFGLGMALAGTSPIGLPPGTPSPAPQPTPRAQGNAPTSRSRKPAAVLMQIEVGPGANRFVTVDDIECRRITYAMDGGDTTATLVAGLDAANLTTGGSVGRRHFKHFLAMLSPDKRVRVIQSFGSGTATLLFQGFPVAPSISWDARRQSVTCECLHEGQELLRHSIETQIEGRVMRARPLLAWSPSSPDLVTIAALPPVFNAEGKGNRTREAYSVTLNGRTHRVHFFCEDGDATDRVGSGPEQEEKAAKKWRYVDALRYVAFCHAAGIAVSTADLMIDTDEFVEMTTPADRSSDPFVRALLQECDDLAIASVNAEEAIHLICDAAGAHYEVATRNLSLGNAPTPEHFVRVWASPESDEDVIPTRRMHQPARFTIPREAPYTDTTGRSDYDIAVSNRALAATLTQDRRAITRPIFLAGVKEYEVTLLLRPGWKPFLHIDRNADGGPLGPVTAENSLDFWEGEFPTKDDGSPSIYNPANPLHVTTPGAADVGRLWIFPDDYAYVRLANQSLASDYVRWKYPINAYTPDDIGKPGEVGAFDGTVYARSDVGGNVADARRWTPRRRPFLELIARHGAGDRSPIVEFNWNATDPYAAMQDADWKRYRGSVQIDAHRAALRITDANLLADPYLLKDPTDGGSLRMLEALIGYDYTTNAEGKEESTLGLPHFFVRITCVVQGDERLSARPAGSGASFVSTRAAIVDLGHERFRYRNRWGQNSILNTQDVEPDPEYQGNDDTAALEKYAQREADRMAGDAAAGDVEIFYIDETHRLGDVFTGCAGLDVLFNRPSTVVRKQIVADANAGYRTILTLEDLREAPETA